MLEEDEEALYLGHSAAACDCVPVIVVVMMLEEPSLSRVIWLSVRLARLRMSVDFMFLSWILENVTSGSSRGKCYLRKCSR